MNPKAFGPIRQIAYVVADLEASMRHWADTAGVGPWTVYRNTRLEGQYRGAPTTVKIHVGLSYQDEVQIELIQVTSRTPSPYQDEAGAALLGPHHVAWHSRDLEGDVQRARARGLQLSFAGGNGLVRVVYLHAPQEPQTRFELIEAVPAVLEGFAAGVEASRRWDGSGNVLQVFDFDAA